MDPDRRLFPVPLAPEVPGRAVRILPVLPPRRRARDVARLEPFPAVRRTLGPARVHPVQLQPDVPAGERVRSRAPGPADPIGCRVHTTVRLGDPEPERSAGPALDRGWTDDPRRAPGLADLQPAGPVPRTVTAGGQLVQRSDLDRERELQSAGARRAGAAGSHDLERPADLGVLPR